MKASYSLFEVVGLELEYPIVDRDLRVRPWVEEVFRRLHGRPTSDVEHGRVGFSNELASHVFELKTLGPRRSLAQAEAELVEGLRAVSRLLADELGGRLLPTGMHPFMDPDEGELWQRSGRRIYQAYDEVFGIGGHGWLNVQSCHVNLPFGSEKETVRLHNATACLLPYLPALAASSPIVEGRLGPEVDNRLTFYGRNQARIPAISGRVIPEYVTSFRDYRARILEPIYRTLRTIPEAARLRHEWVNSRGAILRFSRNALEIRLLDAQECIKMDVAIASFVRAALRWMVRALGDGTMELPDPDLLVEDYRSTVRDGTAARVRAPHLRRTGSGTIAAGQLLLDLLPRAVEETPAAERGYPPLVASRLARGNLAERLRRRLEPLPEGERDGAIRALYDELAECLVDNRVWEG